jgi:hypothetical protein
VPILAVPLLPAAGVLAIIYMGGLLGIVLAVVGVYFAYHLVKYLSGHLRSYIETTDEGLRCRTTVNEDIQMSWSDITHSGLATSSGKQRLLFLYAEGDDKLLTIPQEYDRWGRLVEETRSHVDLPEVALAKDSTVQDHLRLLLDENERE